MSSEEIMSEQRRFNRVDFESFVELGFGEYQHICELFDISINGALVGACTGASPSPGEACKLTINLDDEKETQIIMDAVVAYKIENRVGLHCEAISDDSMVHLRKLVEYNLDDAELIYSDLDAMTEGC